jgi:hypothetical protein
MGNLLQRLDPIQRDEKITYIGEQTGLRSRLSSCHRRL